MVLEGMVPVLMQTPPTTDRASTMATFFFNLEAATAARCPDGPEPTTIRSYLTALMRSSPRKEEADIQKTLHSRRLTQPDGEGDARQMRILAGYMIGTNRHPIPATLFSTANPLASQIYSYMIQRGCELTRRILRRRLILCSSPWPILNANQSSFPWLCRLPLSILGARPSRRAIWPLRAAPKCCTSIAAPRRSSPTFA